MKYVNSKDLNPFYILFGDNDVLKKEFVDEIKILLKEKISDTTIFTFDVSERENQNILEDIIEKVSTPSFFSPRNLVIVREFHKFLKDEIEKLFSFLKNIPEFSNIILISSLDRKEFKKSVIEEIPEKYIYNFSNKNISDTKTWIKEYLKSYQKTIDEDILQYIIDESNSDASLIKNEVDKLLLWIGDRKSIEKEDFNMLRSSDKDYNIWALTDAVGFKDEKQAFAIIEKIIDDFKPEAILGAIFEQIKKIYLIRYYLSKSNHKRVLEIAHYNSRTLEVVKKQVMNFQKVPFVEMLNIIREADKKIKKSRSSGAKIAIYIMLENIFLKINEYEKTAKK